MKGSRECIFPEPRRDSKSSRSARQDKLQQESRKPSFVTHENCTGEEQDEGSCEQQHRPKTAHQRASCDRLVHVPNIRRSLDQVGIKSDPKELAQIQAPSDDVPSDLSYITSYRESKFSNIPKEAPQKRPPWSHLPHDLQFHLQYHQTTVNFHHYFFKHDASHFFHTLLIEQALLYKPLLFAVVGFAAFHWTMKRANGRIQDFLGYYNTSVSLLRKSLANGEPHTDATMLTALQLATFEV